LKIIGLSIKYSLLAAVKKDATKSAIIAMGFTFEDQYLNAHKKIKSLKQTTFLRC